MNNKAEKAKIESLAEKYVKRGKPQEAILEYQKLISGSDQDIPIRTTIGDLYIKIHQNENAVKEFLTIADLYEKKGLFSKSIAILKRVKRLEPGNLDSSKKLAQLYQNQGFISEAKNEYKSLADTLNKKNETKSAIEAYEILLKLSPKEMKLRATLAELYTKEGKTEQALGELNTVAEYHIEKTNLDEAQKILQRARDLREDYLRTLTNLIELYKKQNKKKEALDLVNAILKKDKDNLKALYLLGNTHYEDKNLKDAENIYLKIISIRPKEVEARVKLGKIFIEKGMLDKTYEMFEPLVKTLARKQKGDKAIGLLGLILAKKEAHLPTLEKLAELYRSFGQKENLEIADQVILEQLRKHNAKEKMLRVLEELVNLFPKNESYYHDYRRLRKDLGISESDEQEQPAALSVDESGEIIQTTLSKADLYLEQGLIRNARRILENLRMRFPDDENIQKRLAELRKQAPKIQTGKIAERIEKVKHQETQLLDKIPDTSHGFDAADLQDFHSEDKLTAADIFAETDILPVVTHDGGEKSYFDLAEIIDEEIEAIGSIFNYQMRGDTTIVEKALTDIVSDFRKALDEKVEKDDYESHYNLGIAFLEQGLIDEAIEECKLASKSKKFEIDSYSIISFCLRKKKKNSDALKWLDKALKLSEEGSPQSFALKYDLASLYEVMSEFKKALKIFQEVKKWNNNYRDVAEKIDTLEKSV